MEIIFHIKILRQSLTVITYYNHQGTTVTVSSFQMINQVSCMSFICAYEIIENPQILVLLICCCGFVTDKMHIYKMNSERAVL